MSGSPRSRDWKNLRARFTPLPSGVCLIELKGELDQAVFYELCEFTDTNLTDHETAVIIDMSELEFMDSSGVKFINKLVRIFGYGNVAVYKMNEDINRILMILAMEKKITHLKRPDDLRRWRGEAKYAV